jgi:hypothetical protein
MKMLAWVRSASRPALAVAVALAIAGCVPPGRAFRIYNNTSNASLVVSVTSSAGTRTYVIDPQAVVLLSGSKDPAPEAIRVSTARCAPPAIVTDPPTGGALIIVDPELHVLVSGERAEIGEHAPPTPSMSPC